jgi:hypothetical protein
VGGHHPERDTKSLLPSLYKREVEATLREDSLRELPSLEKRGKRRFLDEYVNSVTDLLVK